MAARYRNRGANPLRHLDKAVKACVLDAVCDSSDKLVDDIRALLEEKHGDGPAWTGALRDSIRYSVDDKSGTYHISFYADAENPINHALYAQFLEDGTGDQGTHTGHTWRYMDRNGHWWTTSGMAADPFLEPPTHDYLDRLQATTKSEVTSVLNYAFYAETKRLYEQAKAQYEKQASKSFKTGLKCRLPVKLPPPDKWSGQTYLNYPNRIRQIIWEGKQLLKGG